MGGRQADGGRKGEGGMVDGAGKRAEEGYWRQEVVGAGWRRRTGRQAIGHCGRPIVVRKFTLQCLGWILNILIVCCSIQLQEHVGRGQSHIVNNGMGGGGKVGRLRGFRGCF